MKILASVIAMAFSLQPPPEPVPGQCGVTMTEAQKNQCKVKTVLSTFDVKKMFRTIFQTTHLRSAILKLMLVSSLTTAVPTLAFGRMNARYEKT